MCIVTMGKVRLDRHQKIALARIVSDLIEADFIVDEGEMDFYEKTISKEGYNISQAMLSEAKKMDYATAVGVLKAADGETRSAIVQTLKDMALSDGSCAQLEAIQIFALEQALDYGARLFSIPAGEAGIDNLKAIYIENQDNTRTDRKIKNDYARIRNDFAMVGMEFVFIPQVVEDYRRMKPSYLEKVVKYMIPMVSDEKIVRICSELCEMTTSKFCRNLLYKKLGIQLADVGPSLLIKINESDVVDKYGADDAERRSFANFLLIELSENNLTQNVGRLVERYRAMVDEEIVVHNKLESSKFKYFGFHRSLFDLIAFGKSKEEYRLVFNFKDGRREVLFVAVDDERKTIPLKLNPQETALYFLVARKSLEGGGLDWRSLPTGSAEQKRSLEEYNSVYRQISHGRESMDYKDRAQIYHIKKRIESLSELANADMFIPCHIKEGRMSFYRIGAQKEYIQFVD